MKKILLFVVTLGLIGSQLLEAGEASIKKQHADRIAALEV